MGGPRRRRNRQSPKYSREREAPGDAIIASRLSTAEDEERLIKMELEFKLLQEERKAEDGKKVKERPWESATDSWWIPDMVCRVPTHDVSVEL